MNFQQVLEYEAANRGSKFRRIDYDAKWGIEFDADAGRLKQWNENGPCKEIELYHHDFLDGEWEVV